MSEGWSGVRQDIRAVRAPGGTVLGGSCGNFEISGPFSLKKTDAHPREQVIRSRIGAIGKFEFSGSFSLKKTVVALRDDKIRPRAGRTGNFEISEPFSSKKTIRKDAFCVSSAPRPLVNTKQPHQAMAGGAA